MMQTEDGQVIEILTCRLDFLFTSAEILQQQLDALRVTDDTLKPFKMFFLKGSFPWRAYPSIPKPMRLK